ncbi:saccharopine dehydrogenase family protein [Tessaracoccus antarcticus]|uniref:Enoyl-ACP reductase n=1 Tax=Tessaracoccus antarcticus TaxID=2479848 RepID=A0A3M0GVW2_9ACTN|nr:saccharopine dehydrogenase NADP-binding domain-containing protein [Tessaracoccus antarcticus]RMB61476.1 enoyl-ACP reductase [Tessaracoccus antarcticus]
MTSRELDLVLYGATGFVGALTAGHLATHAGAEVRIALAGRSRTKLEALREKLGTSAAGWELVTVDAADATGLRRLAARTTAIASTVGPYALYGKELVRACAKEGTHYADLTGEVLFVRWSIDEVNARAAETGARIVHACGFDSVPSDLGVLVTAERVAKDGAGTLRQTTLAVHSLRGGLSGGTIDSGRQQIIAARSDAVARRTISDPHSLSPRRSEEPTSGPASGGGALARLKRWIPVARDAETNHWMGPFMMASFNTRIVRLSNTLTEWSYGREFRYHEVTDFGSTPVSPLKAGGMAIGLAAVLAGLAFRPTRAVLDRMLPTPGDGPNAEQRARGRFRLQIRTTTTSGARYLTKVGADYDPGYDGTAIMLGESALSLALDGDRLPRRSGVLTPATAMGDILVERLRAHSFVFDTSLQPGGHEEPG